ncbi:MAG TPA: PilZ domain-containing protein [Candidatus Margulisiibacteriota bacterium]|nr:PilZ domain-containing protein [Candidatus Margulisiibacteriota bacterium]
MADKRNHMRYITTECVTLKDGEGTLIASDAMLSDISFKGMSLELKERIEPGKVVQFELMAEILGKPLLGRGLVRNANEVKHGKRHIFRVGIEFVDVVDNDISCILNEINRRMRERKKKPVSDGGFDCGPI